MRVQLAPHLVVDDEAHNYYPVVFINEFWLLRDHLIPLNASVSTLTLSLSLSGLSGWKFMMYNQMEESFKMQARDRRLSQRAGRRGRQHAGRASWGRARAWAMSREHTGCSRGLASCQLHPVQGWPASCSTSCSASSSSSSSSAFSAISASSASTSIPERLQAVLCGPAAPAVQQKLVDAAECPPHHQLAAALQRNFGAMADGESDTFKRVLLEGNPWFLGLTGAVSLLHSVFDVLAFKNDIGFWRGKKNVEGLSVRTILLNAFCQARPQS